MARGKGSAATKASRDSAKDVERDAKDRGKDMAKFAEKEKDLEAKEGNEYFQIHERDVQTRQSSNHRPRNQTIVRTQAAANPVSSILLVVADEASQPIKLEELLNYILCAGFQLLIASWPWPVYGLRRLTSCRGAWQKATLLSRVSKCSLKKRVERVEEGLT